MSPHPASSMIQLLFHYAFSLSSSECQIQIISSIPNCNASSLAPITRHILALKLSFQYKNAVLKLMLPTLPLISSRSSSCPICNLPALRTRSCCFSGTCFPNCTTASVVPALNVFQVQECHLHKKCAVVNFSASLFCFHYDLYVPSSSPACLYSWEFWKSQIVLGLSSLWILIVLLSGNPSWAWTWQC